MLQITNLKNLTKSSLCFRTIDGCAAFYRPMIETSEVEVLCVVYLDNDLGVLRVDLRGGASDGVEVSLRDIVSSAIFLNASGVILMHNHPSGDATPSRADKRLTRDIFNILEAISVTLLDHIIVCASGEVSSFRRLDLL